MMDWPHYLMGFAEHAARKSKDATQVGASLVGPDREVRLTAYNGPPQGVVDSPERRERPRKYLFASHAETNLVSFAAREGIITAGCTVYCTHAPCAACARTLIQAGIARVVYGAGTFQGMEEQWEAASAMFEEACVAADHLPPVARAIITTEGTLPWAQEVRDARQTSMLAWVEACFGLAATKPYERAERVLEEAIELAQVEGVALARIHHMAHAVYAKPPGTPAQEAGGLGTCLLAYCESRGITADGAERRELDRITALPPEHFRARHAAKFESGIAIDPLTDGDGR